MHWSVAVLGESYGIFLTEWLSERLSSLVCLAGDCGWVVDSARGGQRDADTSVQSWVGYGYRKNIFS
jgi:hypothetical protein